MRDRIRELKKQLEELSCGVIIWVPEDFPSQDDFDTHIKTVIEVCIERGNTAISDLCNCEEE